MKQNICIEHLNNMQIFLNLNEVLSKIPKKKTFAPKSKFQNKIIIQQ
jgi:hypothetical protein